MGPWKKAVLALGIMSPLADSALAESIWQRRDPRGAYLFTDLRARNIGDLLTIVVNETTEFEGQENSQLNKDTATSAGYRFSGSTGSDGVSRNFNAAFDGSGVSNRKFNGKNNSSIDRRFVDRMTVTVVAVMPNGNLILEGYRRRTVARETRMLRVTGIVRPADIGAFNTVQSQFIGDFDVAYYGRGPESAFTNQGWWGRALNVIWPY